MPLEPADPSRCLYLPCPAHHTTAYFLGARGGRTQGPASRQVPTLPAHSLLTGSLRHEGRLGPPSCPPRLPARPVLGTTNCHPECMWPGCSRSPAWSVRAPCPGHMILPVPHETQGPSWHSGWSRWERGDASPGDARQAVPLLGPGTLLTPRPLKFKLDTGFSGLKPGALTSQGRGAEGRLGPGLQPLSRRSLSPAQAQGTARFLHTQARHHNKTTTS